MKLTALPFFVGLLLIACSRGQSAQLVPSKPPTAISPPASVPPVSPPVGCQSSQQALSDDPPEEKPTVRSDATVALRSALHAFGVAFDTDALDKRLIDTEGTANIDELEDVLTESGIPAVQTMLPPEHVAFASSKSLPAIAVVRSLKGLRFELLWRLKEGRIRVLTSQGELEWIDAPTVVKSLHLHQMTVDAEVLSKPMLDNWFILPLEERLSSLGIEHGSNVVAQAKREGWKGLALLDAATRNLARSKAAQAPEGRLRAILECERQPACPLPVPREDRFVDPREDDRRPVLRGAVIIRLLGC